MSAVAPTPRFEDRTLNIVQDIHHLAIPPEDKVSALQDLLRDQKALPSVDVLSGLLILAQDLGERNTVRQAALEAFVRGIREENVTEEHGAALVEIVKDDYQHQGVRLCALDEALPKVLEANPGAISMRHVDVLRLASLEPIPSKTGIWDGIVYLFTLGKAKPQNVIQRRIDAPEGRRGAVRELCDRIVATQSKHFRVKHDALLHAGFGS